MGRVFCRGGDNIWNEPFHRRNGRKETGGHNEGNVPGTGASCLRTASSCKNRFQGNEREGKEAKEGGGTMRL